MRHVPFLPTPFCSVGLLKQEPHNDALLLRVDAPSPVYVVNGAAGNREGNDHPPGNTSGEAYWPSELNRTNVTSYGVFTIAGPTLTWRQFVSADGSLFDEFTLAKTANSTVG